MNFSNGSDISKVAKFYSARCWMDIEISKNIPAKVREKNCARYCDNKFIDPHGNEQGERNN